MTLPRLLTATLLAGLGCLLAVAVAWQPAPDAATRTAEPVSVAPVADRTGVLAVWEAWDRDRERAWRRGDPAALARLYVPGSAAGRADRALLAAYAGRGLRLAGVRMQRAAVTVVSATSRRAVLVVTDRLAGVTASGPDDSATLPRDNWSTHTVVLRHLRGRWRVSALRQPRPRASTDVTSRSENS